MTLQNNKIKNNISGSPSPNDPDKYIPVKKDDDNDPTKPEPGVKDPKKTDPTRIEEPPKVDPTRLTKP
ncbi:MAG: hypothetical protein K0S44_1210 [Bacteroidetes bacterium]|jgi:hypothetical protein|nr:hypothetical protein [Bacteroidota bacterium]